MPIYLEKSRRNPRRLKAKRRSAKARRNMAFPKPVMIMGERMLADDMNELRELLQLKRELEGGAPPPQTQHQAPPPQDTPQQQPGGFAAFEQAGQQYQQQKMKSDAQAEATKKRRRRTRVARDLYDMVAISMGGLPVVCGPSACMNYTPSDIIEEVTDSTIKGPSSIDRGGYRIGGTATATAMMSQYRVTPADIKAIAQLMSAQRVLLRSSSQQSPASVSMAKQIFKKYMEDEGKPVTLPGEAAPNPRRRRRRYYL